MISSSLHPIRGMILYKTILLLIQIQIQIELLFVYSY